MPQAYRPNRRPQSAQEVSRPQSHAAAAKALYPEGQPFGWVTMTEARLPLWTPGQPVGSP